MDSRFVIYVKESDVQPESVVKSIEHRTRAVTKLKKYKKTEEYTSIWIPVQSQYARIIRPNI